MRKIAAFGLAAVAGVALAVGYAHSKHPYTSGATLSVRALRAPLMVNAQFIGPKVTTLRRGAKVKILSRSGSWYRVSAGGQTGWIHKNRITDATIKMRSGTTSGGATRGEAELAGRGFNPKIEANFRSKHSSLDYSHMTKIQAVDIDPDSAGRFQSSGGITPREKGGGK